MSKEHEFDAELRIMVARYVNDGMDMNAVASLLVGCAEEVDDFMLSLAKDAIVAKQKRAAGRLT